MGGVPLFYAVLSAPADFGYFGFGLSLSATCLNGFWIIIIYDIYPKSTYPNISMSYNKIAVFEAFRIREVDVKVVERSIAIDLDE